MNWCLKTRRFTLQETRLQRKTVEKRWDIGNWYWRVLNQTTTTVFEVHTMTRESYRTNRKNRWLHFVKDIHSLSNHLKTFHIISVIPENVTNKWIGQLPLKRIVRETVHTVFLLNAYIKGKVPPNFSILELPPDSQTITVKLIEY